MEKIYEENWYQKMQKISISGQKNFEGVPVPKQSGTGTTIQKPIGTGTGASGTVPPNRTKSVSVPI